jgi:hypothetical protein
MSDLTTILPAKSPTLEAIEAHWKKRGDAQPSRGYLGGSEIGHHCERFLWYKFRDCTQSEFSGRIYRLFDRGHREEPVFVQELRAIGCEVHEVGPDGRQIGVEAVKGHFKGHADGVALGILEAPKTWHLLEMKTSSAKEFAKIKKEGVEKAKPMHFAQMQVYMQLLKLDRALYEVVNKDTDELYLERVKRDPAKAQALLDRADRIINSYAPPERCADRPDSFLCKFCPAHKLCWGQGESLVPVPARSCRQCCHASPIEGGAWSCNQGREYGDPCERHLMLPGLVHGFEATDSLKGEDGATVIEFSDGTHIFHHGPDGNAGQYSSHDLVTLPRCLVTLPWTAPIKQDGKTMIDLRARYSGQGDHRAWLGSAADLGGEMAKRKMTTPIATAYGVGWQGAEFDGATCAFVWADGSGEIREGVPF